MSEGWISIHRQIWKHWLWEEKRKFSKAEAWIDLLLLANYEDKEKLMNNILITIKRGQLITSEVKLAERWRWDRKTVRRYLGLLENDQMLVKEATTQWTRLTLINYDFYQLGGTTESPTEGTAKGQRRDSRRDTTNKDNKLNNSYSPEFESFWNDYPRKEAKTKAFRCWNARLKEKYGPDDLIRAAKNYAKKCTNSEQKYIKLPATFLGPDKHFEEYLQQEENKPQVKQLTPDELMMKEIDRACEEALK